MSKRLFGGTFQQVVMGLIAALMFIMAVEASQVGFGGFQGFGFFGWNDQGFGWHSATISELNGATRIRVHEAGCRVELDKNGEVVFTDDESDIASLASGAHLELVVRGCGDKFELEAKNAGGKPEVQVKLAGKAVAWDELSRGRFHDALQLIFDTTGYDAEGRVERLWQRGGAAAVLEAAEKLRSDSTQRLFLHTLLGKDALTAADTARVWQAAESGISSDYELTQLILESPDRFGTDEQVRQDLLGALRSIDSDYELHRALEFLLKRDSTDADAIDDLVAVAGDKISSDYEQAEFLTAVASELPPAAPLPRSLAQTMDTLSSDYELRRALDAFVQRPALSRGDLDMLLQVATRGISSDYEMSNFLIAVAEKQNSSEPWPTSLESAIATISSDHEEMKVQKAFKSR